MNQCRISLVALAVLLLALAASPSAPVRAALMINDRTALVGTWACTGTIHGKTSIRGYYLTLRPDGTGTGQVPPGPAGPLKHAPWWNSFHAGAVTWAGPKHFTMMQFMGVPGMTMDCLRT
jgi:hypothetical protein